MKKLIVSLALVSLLGCANFPSDQQITTGVTVSTVTALRYTITNADKRTTVANYIDVIASALRTVTGNPTPEQLMTLMNQAIPSDIRAKYPEIIAFASPLVISAYQYAYDKYGADSKKLYAVLNDIALGLEAGCAPYITRS